jgi:hypothetical protein
MERGRVRHRVVHIFRALRSASPGSVFNPRGDIELVSDEEALLRRATRWPKLSTEDAEHPTTPLCTRANDIGGQFGHTRRRQYVVFCVCVTGDRRSNSEHRKRWSADDVSLSLAHQSAR